MKMKNLRSLLFVILSFVLSSRTEIEVLAQDDVDVPFEEGSRVWINAYGYGVSYSNVAYQVNAINPDTYQLFCDDASPIDLQDTGTYTIYAGYPYGERSKKIDISNQAQKTQANLNALDCWYATGEVCTREPSTELVFRSQLAKISIEVDMSAYTGDISDFSAEAIEAATEYTCGSNHPQEIMPSQTTRTINLKVEKIDDKIEGLLIPSNPGSLKILYVDEDGTHEFSDLLAMPHH